jgi:exodeoxyribonuclease VII small subunit
MTQEIEALSFEEAQKELEAIVGRLEAGELTLNEALGLFERGAKISRSLQYAARASHPARRTTDQRR